MKKIITQEREVTVCDICGKTNDEATIRKCDLCGGDFCSEHRYEIRTGKDGVTQKDFRGIVFSITYGTINVCRKEFETNQDKIFKVLKNKVRNNSSR